jgi:hypothetical protein
MSTGTAWGNVHIRGEGGSPFTLPEALALKGLGLDPVVDSLLLSWEVPFKLKIVSNTMTGADRHEYRRRSEYMRYDG